MKSKRNEKDGIISDLIYSGAWSGLGSTSIEFVKVGVGISTNLHFHYLSDEIFFVVSGQAKIKIGNHLHEASTGSVFFVNKLISHQVSNTGKEEFRFFCISSPSFDEKDFQSVRRIAKKKEPFQC